MNPGHRRGWWAARRPLCSSRFVRKSDCRTTWFEPNSKNFRYSNFVDRLLKLPDFKVLHCTSDSSKVFENLKSIKITVLCRTFRSSKIDFKLNQLYSLSFDYIIKPLTKPHRLRSFFALSLICWLPQEFTGWATRLSLCSSLKKRNSLNAVLNSETEFREFWFF